MKAKKAVLEGEAIGELVLEDGVNPGGVEGFVTVTVGLVVHELAIMDPQLLVNLPKDDGAVAGGAKTVTLGGMAHL